MDVSWVDGERRRVTRICDALRIRIEGVARAMTSDQSARTLSAESADVPDGAYSGDIEAVLITEEQIQQRIAELAESVAARYADAEDDLVLVGVLKGAIMFMTDFARALPIPSQMEFMAVSSYGSSTSTSGVVRILKDLDRDIAGRDVLIVEDIIDSGLTLSWLMKNLATRHPRSLQVCTLLRKPEAVRNIVEVADVGFDIPNDFVVGYGLDYAERYRDLPYIGRLRPAVYER
ncbi:hypoxanthine phosphoribosyltransferase [Gordonia jinhuaensis]|uniref:Hypoxanthine phosphoribosyltransferase n=2 Tax=Gordonia jinhuaensis TaxID=1517702 RepID=A0A916WWH6_9ACTN|nr:hypoxanthine phosphoribosyltransferase [Gordonia jinhuaensis]